MRTVEESGLWRGLAAVIAAFALVPTVWYASASVFILRPRATGGRPADALWLISLVATPILGYLLLLRGLPRWRSPDRGDRWLMVGLSAIYWLVFVPATLLGIFMGAVGFAGGI